MLPARERRGRLAHRRRRSTDLLLAPEQRPADAQHGSRSAPAASSLRPISSATPSRAKSPAACRQSSSGMPAAAAASARISGSSRSSRRRTRAGPRPARTRRRALLGRVGGGAHGRRYLPREVLRPDQRKAQLGGAQPAAARTRSARSGSSARQRRCSVSDDVAVHVTCENARSTRSIARYVNGHARSKNSCARSGSRLRVLR